MGEDPRFQLALETITETISEYGEDTIIAALKLILNEFDYEVVKRDPGPDDDVQSGNVWPRESDLSIVGRAFPGQVISLKKWR